MTVGRVSDFKFPSSGQTQVRGHFRGGKAEPTAKGDDWAHKPTDKMAMGGMVSPPKSGIRAPRPNSAVAAQRHAVGLAIKPSRGPRIGAKLSVAKPPAPPSMNPGALQSATAPMIPPTVGPPQMGGMARGGRLTAAKRNALPASKFAGPNRSFPVNNRSHAGNAKARASQAVNAGRMSKAQAEKIDARADKVLGEKD